MDWQTLFLLPVFTFVSFILGTDAWFLRPLSLFFPTLFFLLRSFVASGLGSANGLAEVGAFVDSAVVRATSSSSYSESTNAGGETY